MAERDRPRPQRVPDAGRAGEARQVVVSWLHGQAGEGRVHCTGWISEAPPGQDDMALLLLYPERHGVAAKMRQLADALDLVEASRPDVPDVPPDTAYLQVDQAAGTVALRYGEMGVFERPVEPGWRDTAVATHTAVLAVGVDPWTGRLADLDAYTARAHRLHHGVIRVAEQ